MGWLYCYEVGSLQTNNSPGKVLPWEPENSTTKLEMHINLNRKIIDISRNINMLLSEFPLTFKEKLIIIKIVYLGINVCMFIPRIIIARI